MSVKALSAVFDRTQATGAAWQVLVALADWADHYGYCYPSYTQIATKARLSRSMVPQALRQLIELGELEQSRRGHGPGDASDGDPVNVRCQYRNLYRILLVKSKVVQPVDYLPKTSPNPEQKTPLKHEVVQPVDHLLVSSVDHLSGRPNPEVVHSTAPGSPIDGVEVVQSARSHIRNKPSGRPSVDPSGTAAAAPADQPEFSHRSFSVGPPLDPADPVDAFALTWNQTMAGTPIRPCRSLTAERRRLIEARLHERPLDQHHAIFQQIARSSYCRGEVKAFVASFRWYIRGPEVAVNALEGQYNDHFSESELTAASRHRFNVWGSGCGHTPTCDSVEACNERVALMLRQRKASA